MTDRVSGYSYKVAVEDLLKALHKADGELRAAIDERDAALAEVARLQEALRKVTCRGCKD